VQDYAKSLHPLDGAVVLAYLGFVVLVGLWFAKRQKSTEDYFVGGRAIPGWAAGISLFASSISTVTFLAYPGHGYGKDWTLLLPCFMLPVVAFVLTLVIIPLYRQVVRMSAYEYLERRFGLGARGYAAILYILLRLFRISFILFLSAKALNTMTGWDIRYVILACGLITLVYTVFGGVQAVIWTDVAQAVIFMGGGLLCAAILLFSPEGGPMRVFEIAYDADKFKMGELSWSLTRPTVTVMVLYGLFFFATDFFTSQDYVQRYLAVATTRKACRGVWVGVCSTMTTWLLFMFLGTLLFSYYTIYPDRLPASIAADQEQVFPYFIMTRLPVGVVGLIVAAMCAAAMSTLSAVMNSMSMVTIYDFSARLWPNMPDHRQLLYGKLATLLWGLVGTAAALLMIRVQAALEFWYVVFSILLGGLLGMFLLAFFVRRAHAWGVYLGLAAGTLVTLWGTLARLGEVARGWGFELPAILQNVEWPLHPFLLVVCSNTTAFVVGYIASLIIPKPAGFDASGLTVWDMRGEGEVAVEAEPVPVPAD